MKLEISHRLRKRAKEMRASSTAAEEILWDALRSRNLNGAKFRRQQVLGSYIVDFYCHEGVLVVEVDGEQHGEADSREYDLGRTRYLESLGLRVLRFWNREVMENLEAVLEKIRSHLGQR